MIATSLFALSLLFHSPPVAFVVIALALSVIAVGFVGFGLFVLVRYGEELNSKGKLVFALIPVGLIALSQVVGLFAAFPFGILAGLLFAAFAGPPDDSWVFLAVWCLLNSFGIYGVIGLFRRRLSVTSREF